MTKVWGEIGSFHSKKSKIGRINVILAGVIENPERNSLKIRVLG